MRMEEVPDPQAPERAKRRSYTAKDHADILAVYDELDRGGRGALLRREGLHSSLISDWHEHAAKGALDEGRRGRPGRANALHERLPECPLAR